MTLVRLFGLPVMERDGIRSSLGVPPKALCLLAFLTTRASRPFMRDALSTGLWPDDDFPISRANLRRHLHLLAKALGDDILIATRHTVQWNGASRATVDVIEFDRRRAVDAGAAVEWYGGALCDGIVDEVVEPLRAEYERCYERVIQEAIVRARATGAADAERFARRALEHNPTDEEAASELMTLRHRSGNRAGAIRVYNELSAAMRRELGVDPSPATLAVFESLAYDAAVTVPTNIAAPRTSIIGRENDIDAVCRLLDSERAVTVVGPPGIGKSRLALAVALGEAQRYPDGVWRVDASSATTRDGVIERLLGALGGSARVSGDDSLTEVLANKDALVLIDNCEHLAEEIASIAALLKRTTRARLLITSRTRIGTDGEAIHRMYPLSPTPALRLFVERATAVDPDFTFRGERQALLHDIVSSVDCIPLAIELVAARAHILSASQIHLRTRTNHPVMERAIAWSYGLLSPRDRKILARFSIFEDLWDIDAAEEVCSERVRRGDVFAALEALIDASLVIAEHDQRDQRDVRYRMLAPIREYATRLLSPREYEHLRQRHADYYRDLAIRHHQAIDAQDGDAFLRAMAGAGTNLLQALKTLSERKDSRDAASLLAAASPFWGRSFQPQIVVSLAQHYIEAGSLARFDPHVRGEMLRAAGRLAFGRAEWALAERLDLEAAMEHERVGERYEAITSRLAAAIAAGYYRLTLEERIENHEAIAADIQAAPLEPPWTLAGVQANLSIMYHQRGDSERALAEALSALATFREHNRHDEAAKLLTILTRIYVTIGRPREAEECATQAVATFRSLGEKATLAEGLRNLARARLAAGRGEDDVYETLGEAIALMQAAPEPRFTVYVAIAAFEAFVHFGRFREAAKAAGLVAALKERMRYGRQDEQLLGPELVSAARRALAEEYVVLEQLGRSGTLGTLREEILTLRGSQKKKPRRASRLP